jgi:hypothetical protein
MGKRSATGWKGAIFGVMMVSCATPKGEGRNDSPTNTSQTQAVMVTPEQNEAIDSLFRRKAQELQRCWNEEYDKLHDRRLEGDLTVGLTVKKSGRPDDVQILNSTMHSPSIEGCVVKEVASWAFPEISADLPYRRIVHLGAAF